MPILSVVAGLLIFALLPQNAYAYIDPGTGSIILQVIFGAIATGLVFFKKIKIAIQSLFAKKKVTDNDR